MSLVRSVKFTRQNKSSVTVFRAANQIVSDHHPVRGGNFDRISVFFLVLNILIGADVTYPIPEELPCCQRPTNEGSSLPEG